MKELCVNIINNFKEYIGDGWLIWWCFAAAVIICFFFCRDNRKKLVTVTLLSLIVVFNPVVYHIVGEKFLSGVYWRLFWIVPILLVIAAALTELVSRIPYKWAKALAMVIAFGIIMKSQTCVFNGDTYTVPANEYQLPQDAVDVADTVLELTDGYGTLIAVPDSLSSYIRQYTSKVTLVYGRNIWGYITGVPEAALDFYGLLHAEELDLPRIYDHAQFLGCRYLVFDTVESALPEKEEMEENGLNYQTSIHQYAIYEIEEQR